LSAAIAQNVVSLALTFGQQSRKLQGVYASQPQWFMMCQDFMPVHMHQQYAQSLPVAIGQKHQPTNNLPAYNES
jgi:hypothetical protein